MRSIFVALCAVLCGCATGSSAARRILVDAEGTATRITTDRITPIDEVILRVEERDQLPGLREAALAVRARSARLGYWIEVARSPALADAEPMRMASLQAHEEWRALFPDAPRPGPGEVVKVWPFVPITTREGFDLQLARVTALLDRLPPADEVLLVDLQAGPSACGCGHPLCRWATDYFLPTTDHPQKIASGIPLGADAAARFVERVAERANGARVTAVVLPECPDGAAQCHGVPCFAGRCWPAFLEQLAPLVARDAPLGVFFPRVPGGDAIGSADVDSALAAMTRSIPPRAGPSFFTIVENRVAGGDDAIRCLVDLDQTWEPRMVSVRARETRHP